MRAWIDVAVLAKTRNLNGRFVARCAAGLPFLLEEGTEVAFVPPQLDIPRRAVVAFARVVGEDDVEVEFEGIGAAEAGMLVGCHCLVARDGVPDEVFAEAPGAWEGWTVVDAHAGPVGEVSGLVDNPGQALLEVRRFDTGETLLVPVVDEIVLDVDVEARHVDVALPQGLMDL